jgi:hypothetical protein
MKNNFSALFNTVNLCIKDYRDLEEKYNKSISTIEKMKSKHSDICTTKIQITTDALNGKTIDRIVHMRGEFGRTYDLYLGFICTDGTRVLLYGGNPCSPAPTLETMKESTFYTDDEIIEKETYLRVKREREEADYKARKKQELDRLQKELGESDR